MEIMSREEMIERLDNLLDDVTKALSGRTVDVPMTTREAAEYAKVNEETIRERANRGEIRHCVLSDGPRAAKRFYRADIDNWLKSRSVGYNASID